MKWIATLFLTLSSILCFAQPPAHENGPENSREKGAKKRGEKAAQTLLLEATKIPVSAKEIKTEFAALLAKSAKPGELYAIYDKMVAAEESANKKVKEIEKFLKAVPQDLLQIAKEIAECDERVNSITDILKEARDTDIPELTYNRKKFLQKADQLREQERTLISKLGDKAKPTSVELNLFRMKDVLTASAQQLQEAELATLDAITAAVSKK